MTTNISKILILLHGFEQHNRKHNNAGGETCCASTSRYCFKIRSTCYTTDILLTNVSHGVCIVAEELYLTRVCGTIEAPDAYVYAVAGTMDTVTLS